MRKIETRQLEEGMITVEPVVTPLGQPLAPAGSIITRQLINRMKLYRVEYAAVEGEEPPAPAPEPKVETKPVKEPAEPPKKKAKTHAQESKTHSQKVAASDEFHTFQIEYVQIVGLMKQTFTAAVQENHPIDTQLLLSQVADLFQSRKTIVEMFDMLYNMRTVTDSVYAHCLNVALISRMIGRWLHFERHELDVLTIAGLLHDIGKLLIPDEVLNKPGALTDEEFALIKKHPKLGYDILKRQTELDSRIAKAALMHHERCDGSGYPTGLTEDFIDNFAMIVGIADVYDAMTAARSYRAPLCPFQVISNFEKDGFQKYHTKYILVFLKQIASAYQSNRAILSDGRGCTIVMLNQNSLSRPIVQFDDNSCLDLSTASKDLYIKAVL
ncbi:MAG: HD-GYP domain-containing protein [Lachnospiraceae bacterium]|nr:HD-GYP domain-containing protein [Lachnospiraceae bacterium]